MIHRDIKPDNFVMGANYNSQTVYIIDYGLSKSYCDPVTRKHMPYKSEKNFVGTARYSSINNHNGYEQSRRDDMESLGYTIIYLMKGKLPWQGVNNKKCHKYEHILKCKKETEFNVLCQGLPTIIMAYMKYCRSLKFEDKPDYLGLKDQFKNYITSNKLDINFEFDWDISKEVKEPQRATSANIKIISPILENFKNAINESNNHKAQGNQTPQIRLDKINSSTIKNMLEVPKAESPFLSIKNSTNCAEANSREYEKSNESCDYNTTDMEEHSKFS